MDTWVQPKQGTEVWSRKVEQDTGNFSLTFLGSYKQKELVRKQNPQWQWESRTQQDCPIQQVTPVRNGAQGSHQELPFPPTEGQWSQNPRFCPVQGKAAPSPGSLNKLFFVFFFRTNNTPKANSTNNLLISNIFPTYTGCEVGCFLNENWPFQRSGVSI